jgi:hypothetical protein
MMNILALAIFCISFWGVFSRRLNDGIVAKHLFSMSAITAVLELLDRQNLPAICASAGFFALALVMWYCRYRKGVKAPPTKDNHPRRRHSDIVL